MVDTCMYLLSAATSRPPVFLICRGCLGNAAEDTKLIEVLRPAKNLARRWPQRYQSMNELSPQIRDEAPQPRIKALPFLLSEASCHKMTF